MTDKEEHFKKMANNLHNALETIISDWAQKLEGETIEANIGTWKFLGRMENSGVFEWRNEKLGISVNATPYWEGKEGIPYSVYSDEDGWLGDEADIFDGSPSSAEEYKEAMKELLRKYDLNLEVGDKIKVAKPIDLYPHTKVEKGETGEVVKVHSHGDPLYEIELDRHHDGLEHWNNKLQIYSDQYPEPTYLEKVEN